MPSTLGIVASEAIPHDFIVTAGNPFAGFTPVNAWKWNSRGASTGFGTKYANPSPSVNPARKVKIHPSGKAIGFTVYGNPYIQVYSFSYSTGFGSKYSDPATSPTAVEASGIDFSPDGTSVVYGTLSGIGSTAPYVHGYPWSLTSGFGTKYSTPVTPPTSSVGGVSFSPDGNTLVTTGFPGIGAYEWSSSGFGTKYSGPEESFNTSASDAEWSPDGNTVLTSGSVGFAGIPANKAWVWTLSGWGSRYNAVTVGTPTYDCSFHPSGQVAGFAYNGSPYVKSFTFTTGVGFGTAYSNPSPLPVGNPGFTIEWSKRMGNDVAIGTGNSPYIQVYSWSNASGYGTKYTNPTTLPTGEVLSVDWFRG